MVIRHPAKVARPFDTALVAEVLVQLKPTAGFPVTFKVTSVPPTAFPKVSTTFTTGWVAKLTPATVEVPLAGSVKDRELAPRLLTTIAVWVDNGPLVAIRLKLPIVVERHPANVAVPLGPIVVSEVLEHEKPGGLPDMLSTTVWPSTGLL